MDNLNNIPSTGNWGDAASKLNDNFNKVKQAVTTVENVSKNNKGYFTSLSALNTAFPSPKAGQTAYVYSEASSTKYYIYNAVNGAWVTSSVEAPSVGVNIAEYTKSGGSSKTTKQVEDDLVQSIRNISGNWFSIPGKYVNEVKGDIMNTPGSNIITDYLDITNVNKIIIKGKSTQAVALCAFYSESKTFISSISGLDKDKKTIEITEIPDNAKYIVATGHGLGDDFLILSTAESLSKDIQDLKNSIAEEELVIINLDSTITEDGYWTYQNGERYVFPTDTYKYNTPVAVQLGDEFITSSSVESGATTGSFHAMLDEDMNIIGAFLTSDGYKITQELIDAGVRYVSFSYRPTDIPMALTLRRVVDNSGMYNKIIKNESDIQNLQSRVVELEEELEIINLDYTITEDSYWWYDNGERTIFPDNNTYKHNTPVAVQLGDEFITSSSIVSGVTSTSFHATLDEDMNIIGALLTSDGYKITQELIDAGVRYVSFSYRPTDTPKTLTLRRVVDNSGMYNKIIKNESDIKNLNSRVVKLEDETPYTPGVAYISGIGAMGASLMYEGNVWFVNAVNSLGAIPYNKAESGVGTPRYFADKLWRGTYCTDEEFEDMDILAIQFASSENLELTTNLLPTAEDYTDSFDLGDPSNQFENTYDPHQNLDYILKFWQKWCYDQKDNPSSKWYGTQHGKPFRVIFVTHWHDARPYYSDAIRTVAERWGCGVCEFDKKIGFSKNQPLPDMTQVSVLYAEDTQEIEGVTYGWHPKRGLHSEYIQGKMAFIFADTIKEYFGLL